MYFRNRKKSAQDVYISDPIDTDKDGNALTLQDIMADDTCIFDDIELRLRAEQLHRCIEQSLAGREREIVVLRYGLNGKRPLTQREVASRLEISRSYVSRLEKKALEKLRNLPEARYVEVLTELLLQAAPHGVGEVLFSAQDRETVGQAAVDAANGKSGGKLTLSGETAPIQGGFILKDGNVEVNCAFDTLVRLQKAETAGQVAQRLFG